MDQFWHSIRVWTIFAALLGVFATKPAYAGVTQWIDIEIVNGHIFIKSEIASVTGRSMIDTGAMSTAINSRFIAASGLTLKEGREVQVSGVVSTEMRPTYRNLDTVMFETPLKFAKVMSLNLGPPELQLLIGADFLNGYVIQFDYPNERMRLISRDSIELKKLKNVTSKRSRDSGGILVRVGFGGKKKTWLLLDTGANAGLVVSRTTAERMDWMDAFETTTTRIGGAISTTTMENFRIPSVQFGPFNIENVLVSMPTEGSKLAMFERERMRGSRLMRKNASDGILGYDVLKHFIVTVDYGKGYVHLSPGEKIEEE